MLLLKKKIPSWLEMTSGSNFVPTKKKIVSSKKVKANEETESERKTTSQQPVFSPSGLDLPSPLIHSLAALTFFQRGAFFVAWKKILSIASENPFIASDRAVHFADVMLIREIPTTVHRVTGWPGCISCGLRGEGERGG